MTEHIARLEREVKWWREHCVAIVEDEGSVRSWDDIREENRMLRMRMKEMKK